MPLRCSVRERSRPKAGVRGLREAALLPGETPAFESLYTAPLLPALVARFREGRGWSAKARAHSQFNINGAISSSNLTVLFIYFIACLFLSDAFSVIIVSMTSY